MIFVEAVGVVLFATVVIAVVTVAVLVVRKAIAALGELRWRFRLRGELPRDWWARFESDLAAYTSSDWSDAREAELHV